LSKSYQPVSFSEVRRGLLNAYSGKLFKDMFIVFPGVLVDPLA